MPGIRLVGGDKVLGYTLEDLGMRNLGPEYSIRIEVAGAFVSIEAEWNRTIQAEGAFFELLHTIPGANTGRLDPLYESLCGWYQYICFVTIVHSHISKS